MSGSFQTLKDAIVAASARNDRADIDACVAQAWQLAQASGQPADEAEAHWCSGLALMHSDHLKALEHFEAALAYYRLDPIMAARIGVNSGAILGRLGRFDEAQAVLEQAETTLQKHGLRLRLPSLLINRAEFEMRRGAYAEMLRYATQAATVSHTIGDTEAVAHARINQAFALIAMSDFAQAKEFLDQAHTAAQAGHYNLLLTRITVNQARLCAAQDQLIEALQLLAHTRNSHDQEVVRNRWQATVAREEAGLYDRLGMFDEGYRAAQLAAQLFAARHLPEESLESALLALQLSLRAETSLPPWIFDDLRWMVHDRTQIWELAQRVASRTSPALQARLAAIEAYPALHPSSANRSTLLAQADSAASQLTHYGLPTPALQAQLIAAALAPKPDAARRYRKIAIDAAQMGLRALEQQAYEGLAGVVRGQAVREALESAVAIATTLRRQMPAEELKAHALTSQSLLYTRLVGAYVCEHRPEAALDALFAAKAGFWADLASAAPVAISPEQLAARAELLVWEERLSLALDDHERQQCSRRIQDALAMLRTSRPERQALPLPASSAIRAMIPADSVAIELMLSKERAWACICHGDGEARWVALGKTNAILEAIRRLMLRQKALQPGSPQQRRARAAAQRQATNAIFADLHDLLITPLSPYLTHERLLLAPDGMLFDLPWTALFDRNCPAQPYLGERHLVTILPSLALLAIPRATNILTNPVALAYADNELTPHIARELRIITQLYPHAQIVEHATTADLARVAAPSFLHVSAHGQLYTNQPLLSRILLADGPFLLADALNLDLRGTALVVLSACETSASARKGGIALALAGSFLAAGTSAVLAGLWQIDAEASALLIEQLYTMLHSGLPLSAALRHAQSVVRTAGYDHPYYWAGLQTLAWTPQVSL